MSLSSQQDKLSPTLSARSVSTTPGNPGSDEAAYMRWTPGFHDKFVDFVNSLALGGSEKAIPKAILQLMDLDGLSNLYCGLQIKEALWLQLENQRKIHEQLEIERKLQLQIEENGRKLEIMFEQQQNTSNSLLNTHKLSSTSNDDT